METFDSLAYLERRFCDLNEQRATYVLGRLHRTLNSYISKKKDLKEGSGMLNVLDFGSGPVIQNCITAAAFSSEIVFSDISVSNRVANQKWLDGDMEAFDWSPHFDYVVKNLERKDEKEAREREQRMRQISKVAFCDALSDTPMEKGYEGPYDVILLCGCLEAACSTFELYKTCSKKIIDSLLKPGGLLFCHATNTQEDTLDLEYPVGDVVHSYISLSHGTVAMVMRECGLKEVEVNFELLSPNSRFVGATSKTPSGFRALSGIKS